jgi:hypothetical protein
MRRLTPEEKQALKEKIKEAGLEERSKPKCATRRRMQCVNNAIS